MTFIFRNRTIFWDISKWNRGQKKWDRENMSDKKILSPYCGKSIHYQESLIFFFFFWVLSTIWKVR